MARKVTIAQMKAAQPQAATAVVPAGYDFAGIVKGLKAGEDGLLKAYVFAAAQGSTHAATLLDGVKTDWQNALKAELVANGCCGEKTAVTRASTCWKMVRLGRTQQAVNVLTVLDNVPLIASGSETAATRYSRAATFVLKDADHMKAFFADPAAWYVADRAVANEKDTSPQGVVEKAARVLKTSLPKAFAVALFGEKAKVAKIPERVRTAMEKAAADYVAAMRILAPEIEEVEEDEVETPSPQATSPVTVSGGGIMGIAEWMNLGCTRDEAIAEIRNVLAKRKAAAD